jgi:hypothetical protein
MATEATPTPADAGSPTEQAAAGEATSRWGALMSNPRRLIVALVLVAVAVAVAVFATATFTSSSANAGNVVATGDLAVGNSKSGAILTASGLVPGDSSTGTVTISNTGSSSGSFSLTTSNLQDTPGAGGQPLSGHLDLVIQDITVPATPTQIYSGKLNAVGTIQLGRWNAGESHTYKFTTTFPNGGTPPSPTGGDNAYKNASTSIQFDWNAVS